MTIWLILAIAGRVGASTISSVLQKRLYQSGWSPTLVVTLSLSLLSLILIPAAIFNASGIIALPAEFWFAVSIAAVLDATGNVLLVRAIGSGELSVIGPLNSYKPLVGLVLGILWLGDRPEWLGIIGMLVILAGSWMIAVPSRVKQGNLPPPDLESPENENSITLPPSPSKIVAIRDRMGSIVLTAAASVFLKQAINEGGELLAFCGWAVGCTTVLWFIAISQGAITQFRILRKLVNRRSIQSFGCLVISYLSLQAITVWIFAHMSIGYALALFQLGSIVQVFLGWHYFGEKQLAQRLTASVVMTAGAICVLISR